MYFWHESQFPQLCHHCMRQCLHNWNYFQLLSRLMPTVDYLMSALHVHYAAYVHLHMNICMTKRGSIMCVCVHWMIILLPEASFCLQHCCCLHLCVCVCVCVCMWVPRSPNLDQGCKTPHLRSLLFWVLNDVDFYGAVSWLPVFPIHGPKCLPASILCMYLSA